MLVRDLSLMPYRQAWALQEEAHAQVLAGGPETLFVVEHPPVITLGRRPGVIRNLRTPEDQLARFGVELVQSDRGGDITFHGPGQIVVYPIIRLADHGLPIGGYVHRLEQTVVEALAELGVSSMRDPTSVGVWIQDGPRMNKICALGVRIRRGISLHGLALNVTTDLRYFDLIVPCGLTTRGVTSLAKVMGERCPPTETVKELLTRHMLRVFDVAANAAGTRLRHSERSEPP